MADNAPFEIIAAPFTIYRAPVGEAFTDLADAVAGNWVIVGLSGDQDYNEDGVIVSLQQTIEKWRGLGGTGPRKAFRTEEDLMIRATVHDQTLENLNLILNDNAVTTTAARASRFRLVRNIKQPSVKREVICWF